MNNDNTASTWDNRQQNMNHWWEIADNKNDAMWNTTYTPPETQQAAKQWLEHSSSIKSVIDDGKCKTQPTNIKPWKKILDLFKCGVFVPIASRPWGNRVTLVTVRTSVRGLTDAVCCMHDHWLRANDDRPLDCSLLALVHRLGRLTENLDGFSDNNCCRCCDRLAVFIEQYHGCREEYRELCARFRGLHGDVTSSCSWPTTYRIVM